MYRCTKLSFGIFEFTETATNTMITLPKGMENGKMEKRAHIVFLHQRHHMKLFKDVRTQIGRFFILVVSASSNETIVHYNDDDSWSILIIRLGIISVLLLLNLPD